MKAMKVFIDETTSKLIDIFAEKVSTQNGIVDLKDLFGRFTMDTIASCAFGVDANSFSRFLKTFFYEYIVNGITDMLSIS
jgi:cytochrome P450